MLDQSRRKTIIFEIKNQNNNFYNSSLSKLRNLLNSLDLVVTKSMILEDQIHTEKQPCKDDVGIGLFLNRIGRNKAEMSQKEQNYDARTKYCLM